MLYKLYSIVLMGVLLAPATSWAEDIDDPNVQTALHNFFSVFNGLTWTNNNGWSADANTDIPCTAYGLYCEGSVLRKITLNNNNLSINEDTSNNIGLAELKSLEILTLNQNQINVEISTLFDVLNLPSALTVIDLGRNSLTGGIPTRIGSLLNLEYLYLAQNQLEGLVPAELKLLTNLRDLVLSGNNLSGLEGDEPFSPFFKSFKNITKIIFRDNKFSGELPFFIYNPELEIIDLSFNDFEDSLFLFAQGNTDTGSDSLVKYIDLSWNNLSGSIPADISASFPKLEVLRLYSNELSGGIPEEMGDFLYLQQLHLDQNRLEGQIPTTLGNLTNLIQLYLSSNKLTGDVPEVLQDNLVKLSDGNGLSIGWNALQVPARLSDWLQEKGNTYSADTPRFNLDTQTRAPLEFTAEYLDYVLELNWQATNTTPQTEGGYIIYQSSTGEDDSYFAIMTIDDKSVTAASIANINPAVGNWFEIRSFTNNFYIENSLHLNLNNVVSRQNSVFVESINVPPTLTVKDTSIARQISAGDTVLIVSGSDGNSEDTVSYTLVSGNDDGVFAFDNDSGMVKINALPTTAGNHSYTLIFRATDNHGLYTDIESKYDISVSTIEVPSSSGAGGINFWSLILVFGLLFRNYRFTRYTFSVK